MKTFTIIKTIRCTETLIIEAETQDEAMSIAEYGDGENNNDYAVLSIDVIKTSDVVEPAQTGLKMTPEGNVIDSNGAVYIAKVGLSGTCYGCDLHYRPCQGALCTEPLRTDYEVTGDVIFVKQV